MTALELETLASAFADSRDPGFVRWRELCHALERLPPARHGASPPRIAPATPHARTGAGRDTDNAARTIERAMASSRAADFSTHVGMLAGLAAGTALVESEAEVERVLSREIAALECEVDHCVHALENGAAALVGLRALEGSIAELDADLAGRRAAALERMRSLLDGWPSESRADDVQAALNAEIELVSAARLEMRACSAEQARAEAELRERVRYVDGTRVHTAHALRVEKAVLGLARTGATMPTGAHASAAVAAAAAADRTNAPKWT
ncbi:hypothetical protein T492DRAFT_911434 [Pavlovales sp. CCMP2436]|nr:hypothetical protein T492DRAFT_911434 [Pavlovales sp. CCMP2436]